MYKDTESGETKKRSLTDVDQEAVRYLYGDSGDNPFSVGGPQCVPEVEMTTLSLRIPDPAGTDPADSLTAATLGKVHDMMILGVAMYRAMALSADAAAIMGTYRLLVTSPDP